MASLDHIFLKIFQEEQPTLTSTVQECVEEQEPVATSEPQLIDTVAFPASEIATGIEAEEEATGINSGRESGPSRRFRELYARRQTEASSNEPSDSLFPLRAFADEEPTTDVTQEAGESILKMYEETPISAPQVEREQEREIEYMAPIVGKLPTSCQRMLQRGAAELASLADAIHESRCTGRRILGFKGVDAGTGCSTLLLGVVGEFVRRGLSVLVIDGNFDNPVLASLLNIKVSFGWEEAVFEKKPLETSLMKVTFPVEKIKRPGPLRPEAFFYFLPLAKKSVSRAIVASCKRQWLDRVHEVAEGFDLVLVDMGRCERNTMQEKVFEMLRFGLEGYYLVRDVRKADEVTLRECIECSTEYDLPCLGIVENFV
ncbi:MAG: cellulose synthase operon protein YhjQ/BcsQ [Planctomycetia bacterium]|nr:cellulose synthase operon protein YhjQ/BcsQ [Planctomycetia bacterium]